MHTVEKHIDGLAIELGQEFCICGVDVTFGLRYNDYGDVMNYTVKVDDIYVCGPSGKYLLANGPIWDIDGLRSQVESEVDFSVYAQDAANYQSYLDELRDEYVDRMYRLKHGR